MKLTRRDFLKYVGIGSAGAAAFALAGCAKDDASAGTTDTAGTTSTTSDTSSVEKVTADQSTTNVDTSKVTEDAVQEVDGKKVLELVWPSTTTSLSPYQSASPAFLAFKNSVLECLGMYDRNYQFYNVLAKNYTQLDDVGLEFEVELYDYIVDSEGNHIDADAIVRLVNWMKENGINSSSLNYVDGVEVSGDYTFLVHMNDSNYGIFTDFMRNCRVVSIDALEASGDQMSTHVIGTGPYKVTEFVSGATLVMEINENYWQTDEAAKGPYAAQNIGIVRETFITENSQRTIALQTGACGVAYKVKGTTVEELDGDDSYAYNAEPGNHVSCLIPSSRGAFADVRMRKALYHAIDIASKIAIVDEGYAFGLNAHALPFFSDYNPEWEKLGYWGYDPDKARALVKEAMADGVTNKVEILASNTNVANAEFLQACLVEVGFEVSVKTEEQATYLIDAYIPEAFDVCTISYTGASAIQLWARVYDQKRNNGATSNGFVDDKLQELLEAAYSLSGHTQENMDALYEYALEQAYFYYMNRTCEITMWRYDSGFIAPHYDNELALCPGICEYTFN